MPVDSQLGSDMFASTPKLLNSTLPVASIRVFEARAVTLGLSAAMKSPSIFSTPLSSMTGSLSVATAMTPGMRRWLVVPSLQLDGKRNWQRGEFGWFLLAQLGDGGDIPVNVLHALNGAVSAEPRMVVVALLHSA